MRYHKHCLGNSRQMVFLWHQQFFGVDLFGHAPKATERRIGSQTVPPLAGAGNGEVISTLIEAGLGDG